MAVNTENTTAASEKIVRSQVSEAFENAKKGIFPDGIDPTKITEPSGLVTLSTINEAIYTTSVENAERDLEILSTLSLTKKELERLLSAIDARSAERFLDNYLVSLLSNKILTRADMVGARGALQEIELQYNYLRLRTGIVDALQDLVIQTSKTSTLQNQPRQTMGIQDPDSALQPLGGENTFAPLARLMRRYDDFCLKSRLENPRIPMEVDQIFDPTIGLRFRQNDGADRLLGLISHNRIAHDILVAQGEKPSKVVDPTRIPLSRLLVYLIHHSSECIDRGYDPGYGLTGQIDPFNPQAVTNSVADLPLISDLGFYDVSRVENLVSPEVLARQIEAARAEILGGVGVDLGFPGGLPRNDLPLEGLPGFPPVDINPNQAVQIWAFDGTKANLNYNRPHNPVKKVTDARIKFRNFSNSPRRAFGDTGEHSMFFSAHFASMIRSEVIQSINIDTVRDSLQGANGRQNLPRLDRFNRLNRDQSRGIGDTLLGSMRNTGNIFTLNSSFEGKTKLDTIVRSSQDAQVIDNNFVFFPFEKNIKKVLSEIGKVEEFPSNGTDAYDAYLSKILDPNYSEGLGQIVGNRESKNRKEELVEKYKETVSKAFDKATAGVDVIKDLISPPTLGENQVAGVATIYRGDPDHTSTPIGIMNTLFERPVTELLNMFHVTGRGQAIASGGGQAGSLTYWNVASNVERDQRILSQVLGVIKSQGQYESSKRLRNMIVTSVIDRDLSRARNFNPERSAFSPRSRRIGYQPSLAGRQAGILETIGGDYKTRSLNNSWYARRTWEYLAQEGCMAEFLPNDFWTDDPPLGSTDAFANGQSIIASLEDMGVELSITTREALLEDVNFIHVGDQPSLAANVTRAQALGPLFQGNKFSDYRVTKMTQGQMISNILSVESTEDRIFGDDTSFAEDKTDLYDLILRIVDDLDTVLTHLAGGTSDFTDGSFNHMIQSSLNLNAGYFDRNSGSTKANALDRSILISLVIDCMAEIYSEVFDISSGVRQHVHHIGNAPAPYGNISLDNFAGAHVNPETFQRFLDAPIVIELRSARAIASVDLDRNRLESSTAFVESYVDNGAQIPAFLNSSQIHSSIYSFEKLGWIFDSIYRVGKTISPGSGDVPFFLLDDVESQTQVAATIARGCTTPSVWPQNNGGPFACHNRGFLSTTVPHFRPTKSDGSPGLEGVVHGHRPFGNYQSTDDVETAFVGSPIEQSLTPWGMTFGRDFESYRITTHKHVSTFFHHVAECFAFVERQKWLPLFGVSLCGSMIDNHLGSLDNVDREWKMFDFTVKESFHNNPDDPLNEGIPRISLTQEISKSQILSKMDYLTLAAKRLREVDEAIIPLLSGGRDPIKSDDLDEIAKLYLRELIQEMESDGVTTKSFAFVGVSPDCFYEKAILNGEICRRAGGEYLGHLRKTDPNSKKANCLVSIDLKGKAISGIEPGLRYKFLEDEASIAPGFNLTETNVYQTINSLRLGEGQRAARSTGPLAENYSEVVDNLFATRTLSLKPASLSFSADEDPIRSVFKMSLGDHDNRGDVTRHSDYTDVNIPFRGDQTEIRRLYKSKLDTFIMSYILDTYCGISLSHLDVGLTSKNIYEFRYNAIRQRLQQYGQTNHSVAEGIGLDFENIWELFTETTIEENNATDPQASGKDLRLLDESFKRLLRPSLGVVQNEEGVSVPGIIPPKAGNEEIAIAQIIADASIMRCYGTPQTATYDEIAMIPIDIDKFEIDMDETFEKFIIVDEETQQRVLSPQVTALDSTANVYVTKIIGTTIIYN